MSDRTCRGYVSAKVFGSNCSETTTHGSETTCAGSSVSELSDLAPWDSPAQSFIQPTAPYMAPSAQEFLQAAMAVAAKAPTKQCLSSFEAEKMRAKMLVQKQLEPRAWPGGKGDNAQQKGTMCVPLPPGLVVGDPAYSRGSKNHAQGMCRPCRSFYSPEGCPKGVNCNFCHCPHDDQAIWEVEQSIVKAAERRRCKQEALSQTCADYMCTSRNCNSCKMHAPVLPASRATAATRPLAMDEPWYVPMPKSLVTSEPVAALLEGTTYSL